MSSKLSDKFRNEISWNGYRSDILKSGLQKYIRRGNVEKALFCAGELDLFKEAPERGETIRTNFIHRLMIIYFEDVANLSIFNEVEDKLTKLALERNKPDRNKEKEEKLISEVVALLCHSKKSRICSHIRAIFNPLYNTPQLLNKYPSIKVLWDQITANELEKKEMNTLEFNCKQFKKYYKEKNILCVYYAFQIDKSQEKLKEKCFKRSIPVWFIFKELQTPFNNSRLEKCMNLYANHLGNMKEGFLCWLLPLLNTLGIVPEGTITLLPSTIISWDKNRKGELIEIDDFVQDRHTRKGHSKGLVDFAINGAYVENEAEFVNIIWKQFYEDGKRYEDGVPIIIKRKRPQVAPAVTVIESEVTAFKFIVRTQLNTSRNKQDVYFAKDNTNKLVVVKGPYQTMNEISKLIENKMWKEKNNLPYINFEVKELIPDRWPEGVALGIRNTINRVENAFFIVFDSVIYEEQIQTKIHSSKVWPETEVVDWDKIPLHFDYRTRILLEQEMIDYVENILYRYVFGISDLADRNFLMTNGRVISIDEETNGSYINLIGELRKNKCIFIQNWLKDNYEKLNIATWSETNQDRLNKIQNKDSCLALFGEI